jgi:pimeloyl-ACP methyl ester carboxylesterase
MPTETTPQTGYAPVNGLQMYYEVHGADGASDATPPLVVLHGAFMSIAAMGPLIPSLAETRQVIGVELQGHGHTADIDRPLHYEQLADDVAALLDHLDVAQADVFGYSLGGGVALQVAIRHPNRVRKLVSASATFNSAGMHPEALAMFPQITPELFAGTPMEAAYLESAPNPDDFPKLVEKVKELDLSPQDWAPEDIRGIPAPTLIIVGDSDGTRLEHAVEMFHLRGGGVMADLAGFPDSQLAILPATSSSPLPRTWASWIAPTGCAR